MATITERFGFTKPAGVDPASIVPLNLNTDNIELYLGRTQDMIAPMYDNTKTYAVGDIVTHESQLYKCNTDISTPETFDVEKWDETTAVSEGSGGGGTEVIPNPQGTPTDTLNTVEIDGTIYEIEGSGGGGSGDAYEETSLYEATSTSFVDITVDWDWNDYNLYVFRVNDALSASENGRTMVLTRGQVRENIQNEHQQYFPKDGNKGCNYYFEENQITARDSTGFVIISIQGVKFGGGGASTVDYSTEEQVVGTWIDGSPVYQKTIVIDSIGDSTSYSTPALNLNIDKVVYLFATVKLGTSGGSQWITSPFIESASYRCDCHYQDSDDKIYIKSNWGATDAIVTIRYTKTLS